MDPNQEVQSEDTHAVEEPKQEVITPMEEVKPSKTFGAKVLPWLIVALVFFIGGMAVIYFTLYQPKLSALKADLQASEVQLTDVSDKLATAETDLASVETNLETAEGTIVDLTDQLIAADLFGSIYKFQADVNAARVALLKLDPASSLQALNFIKTDLAELELKELDPDAIAGFKARIAEAEANLEKDPAKSLSALDTLYNNLVFLISNIQQ
jgi:multidrug resistance efflux pump